MTARRLALPLLLAAAPLRAAEASPAPADSLGQMAFGLVVVIGLLLGLMWLLKRISGPRSAAAGLRVLGAAPVGPRERVVLVEVAGKILVLGVAPGNVRTLHTADADAVAPLTEAAPANAAGKDFPAWLRQALERKRNG